MQRIAFFEDAAAGNFRPLTWLRPTFELRCGHYTVRERLLAAYPRAEWGAFLRPYLAEAYADEYADAHVNNDRWLAAAPTLLINGRWLCDPQAIDSLAPGQVAVCDGVVAGIWIDPEEAAVLSSVPDWTAVLARLANHREVVTLPGRLLEYPWHLIEANPAQLKADFHTRRRGPTKANLNAQVAIQGRDEDVFIDPTAQIDPFVVLDARLGPIWIDAGAKLQPFTRIEGPCYVGAGSQLFRANIREGTTIGPVCRVGGEVEESILHGYANKYHDGFLGHSYVCPWVNLGALSTNSDLKNDYSAVRVPLWGEAIDSGSTKVGCFIGDHAKTAICSLFNTGTSVGVMSMVLPGGELLPKHIPGFSRYWHGAIEDLASVDSAIETARTAMSRRDCSLTPAGERLLRRVEEMTAGERESARERAERTRLAIPGADAVLR
jgi:UDP-N-acetylglucosamine diphosphorylase / glucose-1-phosphate thymidylyltransferase / UDP-N-acetylgalactosamine diphosphorylase / glucosamine-1-phosphate N-acetyltransferase / galactosamine-1-phosphate N-acetyltransferase